MEADSFSFCCFTATWRSEASDAAHTCCDTERDAEEEAEPDEAALVLHIRVSMQTCTTLPKFDQIQSVSSVQSVRGKIHLLYQNKKEKVERSLSLSRIRTWRNTFTAWRILLLSLWQWHVHFILISCLCVKHWAQNYTCTSQWTTSQATTFSWGAKVYPSACASVQHLHIPIVVFLFLFGLNRRDSTHWASAVLVTQASCFPLLPVSVLSWAGHTWATALCSTCRHETDVHLNMSSFQKVKKRIFQFILWILIHSKLKNH